MYILLKIPTCPQVFGSSSSCHHTSSTALKDLFHHHNNTTSLALPRLTKRRESHQLHYSHLLLLSAGVSLMTKIQKVSGSVGVIHLTAARHRKHGNDKHEERELQTLWNPRECGGGDSRAGAS